MLIDTGHKTPSNFQNQQSPFYLVLSAALVRAVCALDRFSSFQCHLKRDHDQETKTTQTQTPKRLAGSQLKQGGLYLSEEAKRRTVTRTRITKEKEQG